MRGRVWLSSNMTPNIAGNRPAAPTMTEDQSVYRRVRLTVRLGGADSQSKCNNF